jgi:hypothetical protein
VDLPEEGNLIPESRLNGENSIKEGTANMKVIYFFRSYNRNPAIEKCGSWWGMCIFSEISIIKCIIQYILLGVALTSA